MNYQTYTATDFAADQFFIEWVLEPCAATENFWEAWLEANPDKQTIVLEAREMVLQLNSTEEELPEWEMQDLYEEINNARATHFSGSSRRLIPWWNSNGLPALLRVAAILTLFMLSAVLLYNFANPSTITYATAFGEKRTIVLPDSSVVVLNANSRLVTDREWTQEKAREVNLTGEAYFSVTHQHNNQKFVVHTSDGVHVEVLGTEFNVSDRGSKSQVMLSSGKVVLTVGDENKTVVMKPGELVNVAKKQHKIEKNEVKPELYTSWKDNKLVFDNAAMRDIALTLEEDYGYPVVFQDQKLADQKLTAYLDTRDLNSLLATLSETLGADIKLENKTIIITSN